MEGVRLVKCPRFLEDSVRWLCSILRQRIELIVDVCAQHVEIGPQIRGALAGDHGGCPGRNVLSTNISKYLKVKMGLANYRDWLLVIKQTST